MDEKLIIKSRLSSLPVLFLLALIVSIVYIVLTYSPGFLSGNGAYWDVQVDDVGTYITGLRFYIRDQWRFPLFYTQLLHYPDGANIIFTDSLPLLAIAAKVIFKTTGAEWNYFGHWFIFSNICFGLSIIFFLDSLKVRSVWLSLIALLFGFAIFPYISRTFHIALSSHFLLILALSFYYRLLDPDRRKGYLTGFLILMVVCLLVHFYLFVITFLIAAAAISTMYLRKRMSVKDILRYGTIAAVVLFCVMYCSGYISLDKSQSYATMSGGWKASMNILSPALPIHSLFFGNPSFDDPTGYQFTEGNNYLGVSVFVLLFFVLIRSHKTVKRGIAEHPILALLCLGLFFYSLSYKIYFGSHLIFEVPLIPGVETIYKTLKATARFFWPSVYLLTLLPVVVAWKTTSKHKILFVALLALAIAQNFEVWPLRQKIRNKTASAKQVEHFSNCQTLIKDHDLVLTDLHAAIYSGKYRNIVRTLYFLAGKDQKLTNYCYTARRLRNPTPMQDLIDKHLDGKMAILFVIPADSKYVEFLKPLQYQFEQDGIIFASNRHDISKLVN